MHPVLEASIARAVDYFRDDERVLGMYLWGSLGKGTADAYSDVDLALVVRDEDYNAVKGELRGVCERICGPIAVWLPEGETADLCNYAFLFHSGKDLLLCDFLILSESAYHRNRSRAEQVLFDRAGLFQPLAEAPRVQPFSPDTLSRTMDNYWVYAYLNGKYYQRADLFKLLYVQGVLFQTHMRLLHALHPDKPWTWWANDVKYLPEAKRQQLLAYFGATDLPGISAALEKELDLFSQDAQAACQQWNLPYPADLETSVRRHLAARSVLKINHPLH
ncbi:MAG TPA: aminoglycoside 6-adenylyltransferase [Chthonomonadaceae bacterium]|nr:aminoglycoside 6-adenylyltransferase [Chthonomonadaceae bacterium]